MISKQRNPSDHWLVAGEEGGYWRGKATSSWWGGWCAWGDDQVHVGRFIWLNVHVVYILWLENVKFIPLRVKPQDPKLPLTFSHVDHRLWILPDFHIALTFPERHRLVEGSSDPMTSSALETATCRIIFQYWVVMLIPPSFDLLCLGKRQEERGGVGGGAFWPVLKRKDSNAHYSKNG